MSIMQVAMRSLAPPDVAGAPTPATLARQCLDAYCPKNVEIDEYTSEKRE